jgi:hypothetical protein
VKLTKEQKKKIAKINKKAKKKMIGFAKVHYPKERFRAIKEDIRRSFDKYSSSTIYGLYIFSMKEEYIIAEKAERKCKLVLENQG